MGLTRYDFSTEVHDPAVFTNYGQKAGAPHSQKHPLSQLGQSFDVELDNITVLVGLEDFITTGAGPGRKIRQRTGIGGMGFEYLADFHLLDALANFYYRHRTRQAF